MAKKTQNPIVLVIILSVLTAAVIGGFFWARSVGAKKQEKKAQTEIEQLMALDLDGNYPGNAREVLKVHNRLMKCYYNDELTDDQLKALAEQNQKLFDMELLARNPYDQYVERLKKEIEGFKASKVIIINSGIQNFSEAEIENRGGYKFCNLLTTYFLKESSGHRRTNQKYYLREDENGNWKILFWEITKKTF